MKITSVTPVPVSAGTAFGARNYMFVKVETDEGITGWGEATSGPKAVATMVEEFGEVLIGKDPGRIEQHWQTLYHHFHVRGGVVQMSAISGIEIALWDIKGKALGVPVYDLLGGPMRERIWCYGRWDGATPEAAVERALSFTEQGITALKGDPFDHRGLFIPIEAERGAIKKLEAVREAVGDDVALLVEVARSACAFGCHQDRERDGAVSPVRVRRAGTASEHRRAPAGGGGGVDSNRHGGTSVHEVGPMPIFSAGRSWQ